MLVIVQPSVNKDYYYYYYYYYYHYYYYLIKVIIRQADLYNKTRGATKGGMGCTIWLHQNIKKSIIFTCKGIISSILDYKPPWKYFNSKIMSILMIIFDVVIFYLICEEIFWSATVVHIQPWWQCIYLVQYYAAMHYNHSSVRKVHLVKGHVVYVYLVDTVYVQNNLPTEFSRRIIFII